MKYTTLLCLLAALIISLSLIGCSRDPKPIEQDSEPEVSLELGEDNSEKEENTKPSLAQLGGEDNEKVSSEEDKEEVKSETQLPSSQEEEKLDVYKRQSISCLRQVWAAASQSSVPCINALVQTKLTTFRVS